MKNFPCLSPREDTLVILFSSLAIYIGVSEDACVWWIQISNSRRRRAARINLLVRSLYAYCTDNVLSQKKSTCTNFRDCIICSRPRKLRTSAASSKLFIVMSPFYVYWCIICFGYPPGFAPTKILVQGFLYLPTMFHPCHICTHQSIPCMFGSH